MEIILIRHAESEDNDKQLYSGAVESQLTQQGRKQADLLSRHLAKTLTHVSSVFTSPQIRARDTADSIARDLFLGEPQGDDRLVEVNLGDWEGLTAQQIEQQFPGMLQGWNSDPESVIVPNAESLDDAFQRLNDFCQEKFAQDPYGRIIVITHGLLIRCFLTKLLMRPLRDIWIFDIDNAGYSLLDLEKNLTQVVKINQIEHLEPKADLE